VNPAVLVLGELNVDLVLGGLSSTPRLGRELIASDFDLTLGSATAIFACQVRKLGHPVTFVGRVGGDDFGRFCVRELEKLGIDTRAIVRSERATGVTLSLPLRGDRAQVTYLGAIAELGERDFSPGVFAAHQHLHLSSFALQKRLRPAFPRLLRRARAAGLTTSLDPNSELRGALGQSVLKLLPQVDLLFLNEREARELSGLNNSARALDALARRARGVIIKLGRRGAIAGLDGQRAHAPASRVRAIDTTGAGDSFAGGFVSAFLRGAALVDCLRLGNLCGSASTAALGGTAGQPTLADVRRAGWLAGNGVAS
jgi:sugar/nucleoside kinase (ribokinase family)